MTSRPANILIAITLIYFLGGALVPGSVLGLSVGQFALIMVVTAAMLGTMVLSARRSAR